MSKQASEGKAAGATHPDNWAFSWKPRGALTPTQQRAETLRMELSRQRANPITLRKFSWEQDQ